jgi:hypothetical protein
VKVWGGVQPVDNENPQVEIRDLADLLRKEAPLSKEARVYIRDSMPEPRCVGLIVENEKTFSIYLQRGSDLLDGLCHEWAHGLAGLDEDHGEVWGVHYSRVYCIALGGSGIPRVGQCTDDEQ